MKFSVDQSQINILFPYVDFFNELLDDWMKSDTIDILEFVPFHWNIGVDMSDYEIFLFTNRYNWIDTDEIENGTCISSEIYNSLMCCIEFRKCVVH